VRRAAKSPVNLAFLLPTSNNSGHKNYRDNQIEKQIGISHLFFLMAGIMRAGC